MSKQPKFTPTAYHAEHSINSNEFTEDEIMSARAEVEKEFAKKNKRLRAFEIAWSIISTIFAIISTSVLLVKNWVDGALSYVILGLLIAYILIFLVLCGLLYRRPDYNLDFKAYGKVIKIFKVLANIAFLVLTAMTMVAVVRESKSLDLGKWAIFIGNLLVAFVKLVLNIVSTIKYIAFRHVAKNYSVRVSHFVDGEEQKKTFSEKHTEKKYR